MTACFDLSAVDSPRRILARLGGDEFVFVDMDFDGRDAAADVGARILEAIGRPYELRGHEIVMTGSVGIPLLADGGMSVDALVQAADAAMYDAKAHDRNNARFYTRELHDKARAQLDVENALRRALANGELELFYQPKVDARTGRLAGAEALLRWRHPQRGMVSPAEFIPVAEETGLIVPIGAWVIREACRQAALWQRDPHLRGMRVAVNVAARQFRDPRLYATVRSALDESGLDSYGLEIEITEGTLMNDTKVGRALLDDFKALGIWIALDDFGTGYSSLGYLRRFPIDTLKIRPVVREGPPDRPRERGHHRRHRRDGQPAAPERRGGGGRDARAARVPGRHRVRGDPGLLLQPRARAPRVREVGRRAGRARDAGGAAAPVARDLHQRHPADPHRGKALRDAVVAVLRIGNAVVVRRCQWDGAGDRRAADSRPLAEARDPRNAEGRSPGPCGRGSCLGLGRDA